MSRVGVIYRGEKARVERLGKVWAGIAEEICSVGTREGNSWKWVKADSARAHLLPRSSSCMHVYTAVGVHACADIKYIYYIWYIGRYRKEERMAKLAEVNGRNACG